MGFYEKKTLNRRPSGTVDLDELDLWGVLVSESPTLARDARVRTNYSKVPKKGVAIRRRASPPEGDEKILYISHIPERKKNLRK